VRDRGSPPGKQGRCGICSEAGFLCRKTLPDPGGADTTAAVERRIAALFRAATSGQRSTAPVNGLPPRNAVQATEGDTVLFPSRVGGGVFIFPLSSFIFPKRGRTHGTGSPPIFSAMTSPKKTPGPKSGSFTSERSLPRIPCHRDRQAWRALSSLQESRSPSLRWSEAIRRSRRN